MRSTRHLFHLAIPVASLAEAKEFYGQKLGATVAREMPDRITLNFFGDQVVCHLAPEHCDSDPKLHPRHFGITFYEKAEWDHMLERARRQEISFFAEPFTRFEGRRDVHETFVLRDPSNNLIEFKFYQDPEMAY